MNFSIGGIAIASIVGLLVAWLYLSTLQTQHDDFRAVESQVACQKARFDSKFGAGDFSQPNPVLAARAEKVCGDQDKRLAAREVTESKSDADRAAVKKSIESIWTNPNSERKKK